MKKESLIKASTQWEAIKEAIKELEASNFALGDTLDSWADSARINGADTFKSVGRDGAAERYDFAGTEDYSSKTIDEMCEDCYALATFNEPSNFEFLNDSVTQEEAEAAHWAILKQCL